MPEYEVPNLMCNGEASPNYRVSWVNEDSAIFP